MDERLFAPAAWPALRQATSDLSWLLSHGYAPTSSVKLVGDRHALAQRQRIAVGRCACSQQAAGRRSSCRIEPPQLHGRELWIDGYNVLTSVEAALAGGVILRARDGCFRDMASMHGSYRKVQETAPAIGLLGQLLHLWGVARCLWLLDRPVSNSGRLKSFLLDVAAKSSWNWQVQLVQNPDSLLSNTEHVIASSDSAILDQCQLWINLARFTITRYIPRALVVDLSSQRPED